MKRVYIRISAFLLSALLLCALVNAASAAELSELIDAVPEAAREAAEEAGAGAGFDVMGAVGGVLRAVLFGGESPLKDALKNAAAVLAAAVLTALCTSLAGGREGINAPKLAGVLAITVIAVGGVKSLIGSCEAAVDELYAFSAALLPTLASASAVTGTVMSSAANMAAATLFLDLMTAISRDVIVPLIYAFVAASAASAAFGGAVKSAAKLIKWAINTLLIVISTAFTLYLSLTGVVASQADATAVKLTRTAVSNLVPVVGKMISDASESIATGLAAIKSAAGIIGVIAIIAIAAGPIVRAAANHLIFKAASALSEPLAGKELSELIADIGTAMGFSMATVGLCAAMLIISVTVTIKAVGG